MWLLIFGCFGFFSFFLALNYSHNLSNALGFWEDFRKHHCFHRPVFFTLPKINLEIQNTEWHHLTNTCDTQEIRNSFKQWSYRKIRESHFWHCSQQLPASSSQRGKLPCIIDWLAMGLQRVKPSEHPAFYFHVILNKKIVRTIENCSQKGPLSAYTPEKIVWPSTAAADFVRVVGIQTT